MSENSTAATDLTSQYVAQVAGDLERNVKEQERVTAEIAALQEQLAVLRHDHTLLVNMQQALGIAAAPAGPVGTPEADAAPDGATVPAPRGKDGAEPGTDRPRRRREKAAARTASGKAAGGSSATGAGRSGKPGTEAEEPKLVELVRRHLGEQNEPRSAAEIAGALGRAHPGRTIRTTVVRSTLEGLVARNRAQRTKQGSSVFYTASGGTEQAPAGGDPRS
ncbi:gamma-butyrolactone-binding regulator SlbR [Streptomyces prasinosporus]|uniref:Gamma-butyrolactone-binding regulator SlbR n=1 Tax=Streptomyces prasinosporus TaxID=68256 RepID=A0ABP6UIY4_9ACTN